MTEARFDELIHASTRLSIVALLAAADWADFSFLRDKLDLSDSALSKQLSTLEEAHYVDIERPVRDRRRRVRARLTPAERHAQRVQDEIGAHVSGELPSRPHGGCRHR